MYRICECQEGGRDWTYQEMSKQPSKAIEEVPYFGPILGSKRGASDTLHRSSGGVAAVGRDEELVVVTKDEPTLRFDYDVGVGERAFQSDTSNQPEQRIGLHTSYGRLTLLPRIGIAEVGSTYQSSHSDEALLSMLSAMNPFLIRSTASRSADSGF